MRNYRRFFSTTLTVVLIAAMSLAPCACQSTERNTEPETQPQDGSDKPVATNQPSNLADDIMSDIDAATDEPHTPGAEARSIRPSTRPARNVVRFIRLKYDGSSSWDVNMGRGFDHNLLLKFNEITGFPVAADTEWKGIARLPRFRKGKAPPFVYITGRGTIELSSREVKILRDYCLEEGGLILADNDGGFFERSFQAVCKRVFPDKKLTDIPDDDPVYREPFVFPKGAPRLWAQGGGTRPMGLRHQGRLIVFYHPGRMGYAWKSGHSGAAEVVADRAYKLGVNIIYYTFTRYLDKHYAEPETRPAAPASVGKQVR
jgi:hypothetical protein